MPVTTRSRKGGGGQENSAPDTNTSSSKRARKSKAARKSKRKPHRNAPDVKQEWGPASAQYKTLQGADFPERILVLPHVLQLIDEFAMEREELMIQAVEAGEYDALAGLSERIGCDVSVAFGYAAEKGRYEAVRALLPEVMGEGEYTLDGEVLGELEGAAVAAAANGHVDVVNLLLGEIHEERED
jgi:hypothetical protein